MTEDEICKRALDALGGLLNQFPTKEEKSDALGAVLITTYNLLRTTEGDEFMRGWLESALADVMSNPPACELRMPH